MNSSSQKMLSGYKGPDVCSRGADPEGCANFFTGELEQVVRPFACTESACFDTSQQTVDKRFSPRLWGGRCHDVVTDGSRLAE
jgi:hypothetical protein